MIFALCFVIFIVCLAMLWNEGMWSNALTLVNTVLAALVATNYFELVADFLDKQQPTYTYVWDFLSLWGLFALTYALLRAFTDTISRHRVRFKMPVEQAGRLSFAAATGWVMICFTLMTLHTAPLAQTAFRGSFQPQPMSNDFLGMAPDRMWLGFVQSRSRGALSLSNPNVFDPSGEFILKYGSRRDNFSKQPELRVQR
jgi:hypothetical protein